VAVYRTRHESYFNPDPTIGKPPQEQNPKILTVPFIPLYSRQTKRQARVYLLFGNAPGLLSQLIPF
jgi:hypothetical protein